MIKAIEITKQEFISSSQRTEQYLSWHRLFKKAFKSFLFKKGTSLVKISSPNHFNMSGFFTMASGQIYYFSISDIRWSKDTMLIRTAKDYKDYTGGVNGFVSLSSAEQFEGEFDNIVH